jgi:hypothetical protein
MIRFLILVLFCSPILVSAQDSSEFIIRVLGGEDTEAPTTPEFLSVSPVAPTQIDLSWTTSADNFLLSGYVLWRDGSPIATTTSTSFIDTGLTPETTYIYEVYAYDFYYNYSSSSLPVATTTPAVPVPPPPASSTPPSSPLSVFALRNLNIEPGLTNARFSWDTSLVSKFSLRWGTSDAYDGGFVVNDIYKSSHQTIITDLEPGALYYYELIGYTIDGTAIKLGEGTFRTIVRETTVPSNVSGFVAIVSGEDVKLTWSNSSLRPGEKVRIVRSHFGWPADPYDGAVVYEGILSEYLDIGALRDRDRQYYTLFVVGADGSYSSGAIALAQSVTAQPEIEDMPGMVVPPVEEPVEVVVVPTFDFDVGNIKFTQKDVTQTLKDKLIKINSDENFIISIPVTALPARLKSIVVTLTDPADSRKSFSFLLRINKDRTDYEAVIAPLLVSGHSLVTVDIYDLERKVVASYKKTVELERGEVELGEVIFPDLIIKRFGDLKLPALILLLGLSTWWFIIWRRRKAEDNQ